jgi:chromosome segregation ATPase
LAYHTGVYDASLADLRVANALLEDERDLSLDGIEAMKRALSRAVDRGVRAETERDALKVKVQEVAALGFGADCETYRLAEERDEWAKSARVFQAERNEAVREANALRAERDALGKELRETRLEIAAHLGKAYCCGCGRMKYHLIQEGHGFGDCNA